MHSIGRCMKSNKILYLNSMSIYVVLKQPLRWHVPKFGGWENETISYTVYFENASARREKAGIRMSSNDHLENPDASVHTKGDPESDCDSQPLPVPLVADSNKPDSAGKHQGRHKSMALESGSEKSNTNHRGGYSVQRKIRPEGSSFSSSVSGQSTPTGTSNQVDANEQHLRMTSIPTFEEWDETDPTSGERFTVIIDKVEEEEKAPSFSVPTVPQQPSKHESPSWFSKVRFIVLKFVESSGKEFNVPRKFVESSGKEFNVPRKFAESSDKEFNVPRIRFRGQRVSPTMDLGS